MTFDEYLTIRDLLERKSLQLMGHERKAFAKTGVPIENISFLDYGNKTHFFWKTNPFKLIIEQVLFDARDKFPELFGTGDANNVISAIYQIDSIGFSFQQFKEFLRVEQFCYVLEMQNGTLNNQILRIDLFRHMKKGSNGKEDFVGGLFHALKHFTHSGRALTTECHNNDIKSLEYLLISISKAFFDESMIHKYGQNYESVIEFQDGYRLKVGFFYEPNSDIYFINTAYRF